MLTSKGALDMKVEGGFDIKEIYNNKETRDQIASILINIKSRLGCGNWELIKRIGYGRPDEDKWKLDYWLDPAVIKNVSDYGLFKACVQYINEKFPEYLMQFGSRESAIRIGRELNRYFVSSSAYEDFSLETKAARHKFAGIFSVGDGRSIGRLEGRPKTNNCIWALPVDGEDFLVVHRFTYSELKRSDSNSSHFDVTSKRLGYIGGVSRRHSGFGFAREWGLMCILRSSERPDHSSIESWVFTDDDTINRVVINIGSNFLGEPIVPKEIFREKHSSNPSSPLYQVNDDLDDFDKVLHKIMWRV